MKLRLWIALALALALTAALTLTAFAEEALVIEDAPIIEDRLVIEDELVIEDALTDGEADLTLDGTIGLLPDDITPDEGMAANGVEGNTDYPVKRWAELKQRIESAQNGDTIVLASDISFEGDEPIIIDGKTVTVDINTLQIFGYKDNYPIIQINNGGELVLKGATSDKRGFGIIKDNLAVDVSINGRFTMESGTIKENNMGVSNGGIFTMKDALITKNNYGVHNYGTFIAGTTFSKCMITGNKYGVVSILLDTPALTVSGRVNIMGNTNADVLLMKGQVVAVGGPLDQYSLIGITLSDTNLPGPGKPVVVTKGLKGNGTAENFFVWGDYETGINADGELEVSLKASPTSPVPDMTLLAKLTASGKKALHLTWTAVDGAQGYDVYFGKCGEKLIKVATVTDGRSCKLKNLKKGKTYRAYVKAWTRAGGSKEYIGESSPKVYAIAGGYNNSRCNPKAVKVEKDKLSLKVGGSAKIKASVKGGKAGKKVLQKVNLVRYYSTNTNVATVSPSGKVTGVGVGSCKVWVVANNGVRKGVTIIVK